MSKLPIQVQCPRCLQLCNWEGNVFKPFCSEHCKTQDLGNWAMEKYRIGSEETEVSEEQVGRKRDD